MWIRGFSAREQESGSSACVLILRALKREYKCLIIIGNACSTLAVETRRLPLAAIIAQCLVRSVVYKTAYMDFVVFAAPPFSSLFPFPHGGIRFLFRELKRKKRASLNTGFIRWAMTVQHICQINKNLLDYD